MTVDVNRMIEMIGETPEAMIKSGVLKSTQKPKPKFSGDDELTLHMIREGVRLVFNRESNELRHVSLTLINNDKPSYKFPNKLPSPLMEDMSKEFIREKLGSPVVSRPPRTFMGISTGGVDQYYHEGTDQGVSILAYYSVDNKVKSIKFMKTEEVNFPS